MAGWHTPTNFVNGTLVTEAMLDDLSSLLTTGCMVPLQEIVLASSAANMDFLSIPATFRNLFILLAMRGDVAAVGIGLNLRMNNDSGASAYASQYVAGTNATPSAGVNTAVSSINMTSIPAASAPAGAIGMSMVVLPSYAGSTLHKGAVCISGYRTGSGAADQGAALTFGTWLSTAAINRLTVFPASGNFVAGSILSLYGLPMLG
jgi:hypothetical protein